MNAIGPALKLGKTEARFDPRTLSMTKYMTSAMPRSPLRVTWGDAFKSWGMMSNDQYGCCVESGAGHFIQCATFNAQGHAVTPTDNDILKAYADVTGFDPRQTQPDGSNPTDNGTNMLTFLNYWRMVGVAGHKLGAFAILEHRNIEHVKDTLYLFGGVYVGLALPVSAQQQIRTGQPWWLTGGNTAIPGSWGGHCVIIVDYDEKGLTCVTWGSLQRMTWQFFLHYCDEAYALLSYDWINGARLAPNGFAMDALVSDLQLVQAA